MARIRTIKPEFPQSECIGKLSRDARLLFILLWTIVDDAGRTRAAPRMLASLLFPYDDDAAKMIGGWLGELEQVGCVRRYAFEGGAYLDIPQWLRHQKIDKPSASRLPAFAEPALTALDGAPSSAPNSPNPREASRDLAEPSRSLAPDLGPRTVGREQEKEESSLRSLSRNAIDDELASVYRRIEAAERRKAPKARGRTKIAEDAQPSPMDTEAASQVGLSADGFRAEWRKFRDHHLSKGSLMADWAAAWRTWLGNMSDFKRGPPRTAPPIRTNTYLQAAMESQADENHARFNEFDDSDQNAAGLLES